MKIIRTHKRKLPLSNSGNLSLYFIGTGSAFVKSLFQNNVIVVKGNQHLVIDCGTRCMEGLNTVNISAVELKNFLITHTHADHIGGLEEVMLTNRYVAHQRPRMILTETFEKILWNQSLRGGSAWSECHQGEPLEFHDFWQVLRPTLASGMPRETWSYRLGELDLLMPRTCHIPDSAQSWRDSFWSCAVILDRRILFTSDTRYDPELILAFDRLLNLEIIFHDCQFFTGGVHASLAEISQLPPKIKAKTLLMHYGDTWRDYQDAVKAAGFLGFARQGHTYSFPGD